MNIFHNIGFCNKCKKRIDRPKFLRQANINAPHGINIGCPHCKKGRFNFKVIKKDEHKKEEKQ